MLFRSASLTEPLTPGMLARVEGVAWTEVLFNGIAAQRVSDTVVVVPTQLAPGNARADVRIDGTQLTREVPIVAASPALFVAVNEDGSVSSAEHPADRGSVLVLYGTGQGVEAQPVKVRFGDYDGDLLYSGPVAAYPGLWQVNTRVPAGFFPPGTYALSVSVGAAVSPALTVEVR